MKKIILILLITVVYTQAWEVNTHRAIDKRADANATNLKKFIDTSGIKNENYKDERFEAYGLTYFEYFDHQKSSNAMADLNQKFSDKHTYEDLIEAGCMLEDAVWQNNAVFGANGRFLNHFYNLQDGGAGLWKNNNALDWAKGLGSSSGRFNYYSYSEAIDYFRRGFSGQDKNERKRFQAKMLVSVGHLMHLFNDMNVPAHTRGDAHPSGDPLEVWMKGGENHKGSTGFYIFGNSFKGELKYLNTVPNKFVDFETSFISEAKRTSEEFLSEDVMFGDLPLPSSDGVKIEKKAYDIKGKGAKFTYAVKGDKIMSRAQKSLLWGGKYVYFVDDSVISNPVHLSSGKVLIKRAIANAAGFVNYFFRGSIDVQVLADGISIKNDSNETSVQDGSVVTFHDGEFQIYWDDEDGVRHALLDEPHKLDNDLVPNDEEIIDELSDEQKEKLLNHNSTVVYTGFIGTEESVAVYSMKNFIIKKEDWAKLGEDENSTYITGLEAYSMPSNKINIVSERVDVNVSKCFERYIEFNMTESSTFTFKTKDERVKEDKRELEHHSSSGLDDTFVYYRIKKAEDSPLLIDITPRVNIVATRKSNSEEKINVKYGIRKNNLTATSDGQDACVGIPKLLHEGYIDLAGVLPFKYRDTKNHPNRVINKIEIKDAKKKEKFLKRNIKVKDDGSWSARVKYETHGINQAFIEVIGYNNDRVVMTETHYLVKKQ